MSAAATAERSAITPVGWLLIALRLFLLVALLLFCLPLYYLWRLLRLPRFWPRIFLGGVGIIAGLKMTIRGKPRGHALLLSNHVSWLDIPAIAWANGSAFVGHSGLASVPLVRHLCAMNDTVFIARHERSTVTRQIDQIRNAISEIGALTLFPEGTTGDGVTLLPFKSSLLSAAEMLPDGASVQPVLLQYRDAPEIAWVGDEHGVDNFLRILARTRPIDLTIHFLPELAGKDLAERKAISAAARRSIEAALADARSS